MLFAGLAVYDSGVDRATQRWFASRDASLSLLTLVIRRRNGAEHRHRVDTREDGDVHAYSSVGGAVALGMTHPRKLV